MSAPPRGARGGGATRGRASTPPTTRGRDPRRGSVLLQPRGRGRGGAASTTNPKAEGLLQGLQAGSLNKRGSDNATARGVRGHGSTAHGSSTSRVAFAHNSRSLNAPKAAANGSASAPVPPSHKDYMSEMTAKWNLLKQKREAERSRAIRDGFLADPEKKTSLDKAITPVGTCTEMCPEFERVERIVQNMVDKTEKVRNEETGRDTPSEERMVKRFRRSAAGYDEQLPSDIRTPATLKNTLDYLLNDVVSGGEKLASVHKFVWDRTRGIRNDFSIQQVTHKEDVMLAVDCLERIARFHILSLHQLSNPENLVGEQFDAHQDREQLNNTLLSLMYYYDDNRNKQPFRNEAEFRAYCIIFELQSQHPDLEDRMQSWPKALLNDGRVKTAFKLHASAGNNLFEQGPLRPTTPFSLAQGNYGSFWTILQSKAVSYLMACVAEIYFGQIRFMTLQSLWTAAKSAPVTTRAKNQDWTLAELAIVLGFDTEQQSFEFCENFGLQFSTNDNGVQYLDVTANIDSLDKSSIPNKQVFSHGIVEAKRFKRTLAAVVNGVTVPQAIKLGLVEADQEGSGVEVDIDQSNDLSSLFFPENREADSIKPGPQFAPSFNPQAPTFTPSTFAQPQAMAKPFGQPATSDAPKLAPTYPFAPSTGAASSANPFATSTPFDTFTVHSFSGFNSKPSGATPQLQPQNSTAAQPFSFSFGAASTAVSSAPTLSTAPFTVSSISTAGPFPSSPFPGQKLPEQGQNTAILGPNPPLVPHAPSSPSRRSPQQATVPLATTQSLTNSQSLPPFGTSLQPASPFQFKPSSQPTPHPPIQKNSGFNPQQPANPAAGQLLPSGPPFQSLTNPFQTTVSSTADTSLVAEPQKPGASFAPFSTTKPLSPFLSSPQTKDPAPGIPKSTVGTQSVSALASVAAPLRSYTPVKTQFQATTSSTPPSPPPKPKFTPADRERVVDVLAQLAFVQPDGLMLQWLQHHVPGILFHAIKQVSVEIEENEIRSARTRILSKKYGLRWRRLAWSNGLKRRAKIRRRRLAECILKDSLRQSNSAAELDEIRKAAEESKNIKEEIARAAAVQAEEERAARTAKAAQERKQNQVAGQKRKSNDFEKRQATNQEEKPRKALKGHKRSRTAGHLGTSMMSRSSFLPRQSVRLTSPAPMGISIFSGKPSVFGRPKPGPTLGRSFSGRRQLDTTRTDYFRLKALGIDPDTPMIPDTEETLDFKRRRREEAHAAVVAKSRIRPSTGMSPPIRKSISSVLADPEPAPSLQSTPSLPSPVAAPPITAFNLEDDPLLRQFREARAALARDTEWFRTQTLEGEKEIEQQEELRRSLSSRDSPQTTTSGLARARTGYEYLPAPSTPGHSLSRTEQRIRATGAHGLATKPIGGTPDYLPVAMSQHSALRNDLDLEYKRAKLTTNGSSKKWKKDGEVDRTYQHSKAEENSEEDETEYVAATQKTSSYKGKEPADLCSGAGQKAPQDRVGKWQNETVPANGLYQDPVSSLETHDEGEEADGEPEEDEELLREDDGGDYGSAEGFFEDTEEYDEEEDYDDEGEEEESPAQSSQYLQPPRVFDERYDEAPSPNGGVGMSRATSGTGASADDALVLDSD